MSKSYQVAVVEWIDSVGHGGWHKINEATTQPDQCVSAGIVLKRCKSHILLTQSLSFRNNADNDILIPRKCVKSIRIVDKVSAPE